MRIALPEVLPFTPPAPPGWPAKADDATWRGPVGESIFLSVLEDAFRGRLPDAWERFQLPTLAVFRLIGADADAAVRWVAACAETVALRPSATRTAMTMRIMNCLLSASGRRTQT